jgi:uncharacterized protein
MSFTEVLLPSPLPVSYARRSIGLLAGLAIIGFGDAFVVGANLGTSPFGTVIVSLAHRLGWSVGNAVIIIGLCLVAIASLFTRRAPGKVAFIAPVICGMVDNIVLPHAHSTGTSRWFFGIAGMVVMSIGIGVYVGAGLGRAAVESIVDRIVAITGHPVSWIMTAWQVTCLVLALALRGHVGVLTFAFPLIVPSIAGAVIARSPWLPKSHTAKPAGVVARVSGHVTQRVNGHLTTRTERRAAHRHDCHRASMPTLVSTMVATTTSTDPHF